MPIVIHSNLPLLTAQGVTAPVVLQPGSVISARVQQVLTNDTVRIVISGQALDVQSQVSLQAGQVLQLAVSQAADGGIALAVVSQQAAPASQSPSTAGSAGATTTDSITLAPQAAAAVAAQTAPTAAAAKVQLTLTEALAVSVAVQSAAARQTSLAQLFANLGVAAGLDNLAPQVQQAVALVLAQRTPLDSGLTGDDINQAFQSSGLFLEASLASGTFSSSAASTDLKAALIVLRQVLANSLGTVTPSVPSAPGAPPSAPAPASLSQQSPAAAVAAVPQGATPTTASVQQVATPVAATPQSASAPAVAVPAGTPATAAAAQQPATIVLAVSLEQGAQPPPIQILTQQVTLTAELETPIVVSPALAPVQVEPAATSVPAQAAAAAPTAQNIPGAAVANALTAAASGSADAATRAAATSAALNLLQEALQAAPPMVANSWGQLLENGEMLSLVPAVAGARSPEGDEIELSRSNVPPPPLSGALPAPQPVLPATLVSNSAAESAMHRLLADTDAAIARQTLLQVASLPGQTDQAPARLDPAAPRWNFEIPFATPQGTAMAQFEISRDGGGDQASAGRVWRARFSLDVEPAGPVHALVSLSGEKTSVRLWAERPATAAQLRAGTAQLSQALSRAELRPGDIVVRDGAPAPVAPARAGHFLDRAL
jgi:hypothetical protein